MANYTYGKTLPSVENGAVLEGHNFCQLVPGTAIFAGITGLTFRRCNLVNCLIPADAVTEACNTSQISRCSHVNPEWLSLGLPQCAENCAHSSADEVYIDGVLAHISYTYEDQAV